MCNSKKPNETKPYWIKFFEDVYVGTSTLIARKEKILGLLLEKDSELPDSDQEVLHAFYYIADENYDQALEHLNKIKDDGGNTITNLCLHFAKGEATLGKAKLERNDIEEARELFKKSVNAFNDCQTSDKDNQTDSSIEIDGVSIDFAKLLKNLGLALAYFNEAESLKYLLFVKQSEHKLNKGDLKNLYVDAIEKLRDIGSISDNDFVYYWNLMGDIVRSLSAYHDSEEDQKEFNYKKAMEYYDIAKGIKVKGDKDAAPYNGAGRVELKRGNLVEAIQLFEETLRIDNKFLYAKAYLGDCYYIAGDYDKAVECYEYIVNQKVELLPKQDNNQNGFQTVVEYLQNNIRIKKDGLGVPEVKHEIPEQMRYWKTFSMALYGLGKTYYEMAKKGHYDLFVDSKYYLDYAMEFSPGLVYIYSHYGRVLNREFQLSQTQDTDTMKKILEAMKKKFEKATEIFLVRGLAGKVQGIKDTYFKKIEQYERLVDDIKSVKNKILLDTQVIEMRMLSNTKNNLQSFLDNEPLQDLHKKATDENIVCFEALRKWNSYTPLVSNGSGGGYFFTYQGKGIVVDPGYNFIQLFRSAGHKFHEIDAVFISHAHDDHTADLEAIFNLTRQYNANLKEEILYSKYARRYDKSKAEIKEMVDDQGNDSEIKKSLEKEYEAQKKKIEIHCCREVYDKFEGMHKLWDTDFYNWIEPPEETFQEKIYELVPENFKINTIPCKHKTYKNENGGCDGFYFNDEKNKCSFVYTADTGWDESIFNDVKEKLEYEENIILLAHIGSFKEYELKNNEDECYYKNHLGRNGLIEIVNCLKPKVCLISEFGEEFSGLRKEVADVFNHAYSAERIKTRFIPVDVGLKMKLGKEPTIRAITDINHVTKKIKYEYIPIDDVQYDEIDSTNTIIYYKKGAYRDSEFTDAFISDCYTIG